MTDPDAMRTIRMNQTPLCHRLLRPHTPVPVSRDEEVNTLNRILADRGAMGCVGSGCALWVPEVRMVHGAASYRERTGEGWCADNPKVVRPDPVLLKEAQTGAKEK